MRRIAVLSAVLFSACSAPDAPPATPAPAPAPPRADIRPLNIPKLASSNDSATYAIARADAAWVARHLDLVLGELELGDEPRGGIRIASMKPGSVAGQFELNPGDVIRSINGQPLTTLKSFLELLKQDVLRRASTVTMGIERGGNVRALVIRPAK